MAAFGGGGFGNRSGFGQTASTFGGNAFGASSAPFGGQSALGSQSNPLFSSQPQSFSTFGQSAPFGAGSFGAQSAPAFGSGFGSSGFGGQSNAAFGSGISAQSSAAFGASGGFGSGSSLFGTNRPPTGAFGASSPFGQSQSAWGQSSAAFGGSSSFATGGGLFANAGPSNSVFGQNAGVFGAGNQGQKGTAGASWQITTEYDGGPGQSSKYHSITMMSQFRDRSIEELRVEDYASGKTGGNQGGGGSLVGNVGNSSAGLFGDRGSAFGASMGGLGSGSVPGNTGGFGAASNSGGFGQSSSGGLFSGGGGFGASSGFGQSSGGVFTGGNTFGAQSAGGIFAQSASAFGGQSGGGFGNTSGSVFGSPSGFAVPQSAGLFGGGTSTFGGAQQSQPSFGVGSSQPGLFGASAQPAGNTVFGSSGGAQSTPSLFGSNMGQPNMFGGGASGSGFSSFYTNNAGAQKPGFGSTGASAFGTNMFGASAAGNAGGVSFGGPSTGQIASNTVFGLGGSTFGGQPGQQQAQLRNTFGAPTAPVNPAFGATLGAGNNPTLQGTFAAVTQENGATVAPPGANYGTVLYNLQRLQNELGEHKKLLEQQAKTTAENTPKPPGTVSVVVLPPPRLISFSEGRGRSSVSGYGWSGSTSQRTKMRGVAGRVGGAAARISGTPARSSPEKSSDDVPATPATASAGVVRRMSFFSPQQFSGTVRPRTIRASALPTPIPTTATLLPLPETSRERASAGSVVERLASSDATHLNTPGLQNGNVSSDRHSEPQGNIAPGVSHERRNMMSAAKGSLGAPNGQMTIGASIAGAENGAVRDDGANIITRRRSRNSSTGDPGDADFVWAQERPSSWSLNRLPDSDDQYNPHKYLPSQTKPGFYTVPSMADLASRTMTELQQVQSFTVGREGYGEITWSDPVDVRGLDLDAVVDIQRGEVAVYPENEAQQLDAPARVKLEGMFSKKRNVGNTTADEEQRERYRQKLQNYCDRHDLLFIDYDAAKGEWLFEVQTFAD